MMLMLVMGTSWAVIRAVTEASRNTVNQQVATGEALRHAKYALLGYVAQQAITSDVPGRFPCPENAGSVGTANEGTAGTCNTLPAIGRLPWKTLGIDKPVDSAGEALWYAIGSSARNAPINFSTTGALTLDGTSNAAVAVIIAPGEALNIASSTASAPSPCVKRNQSAGRTASSLNSSDFVECGNATLTAFVSSRNDTWGNDRVVAITATEMLKAIEGPVADRIQRVVAPALNGSPSSSTSWYQNSSLSEWGTKFFPYASNWTDPTTSNSCGDYGATEGLLPLATGVVATGSTCSARWTSASMTKLSGSGIFLSLGCTPDTTHMRCQFWFTGSPVIRVTASAPNIAMGFRTSPKSWEITYTPTSAGGTVNSLTPSIVAATGAGQAVLQVTMSNKSSFTSSSINVPHPDDSFLINTDTGSNSELAWFINNQWNRYTYYAISTAVSANPSGTCTSSDVTDCLTLNNAETGSGNTNDKRIALILSGRALSGKTQPSASVSDYFEAENDQTSTPGRTFARAPMTANFNDRPSVCPFQRQTTGAANVFCD
jgi:hypothetical protein